MPAEISESDLLERIQSYPDIAELDPAKVAAAIKKLHSNQLNILGSEEEILACAERIAKQILADEQIQRD